jgi:hypothetical protein
MIDSKTATRQWLVVQVLRTCVCPVRKRFVLSFFHISQKMFPCSLFMSLNKDIEETLLRDIERKGIPLAQISLVDICDNSPAIYGRAGKARRPVQQRWAKIKKLKPRSYLALLHEYKIPPSPATLAAVESKNSKPAETIDNQEEDITDKDDEEIIIDDDKESIIDDEETIIDDDEETIIDNEPTTDEEPTNEEPSTAEDSSASNIASTFASLSIKPTTMFSTPTKTPKKSPFLPSMTSPNPSVDFAETATEEEVLEDAVADSILDCRNQKGTKRLPCITLVDCLHPERNGVFDSTCFEEVEENDSDRDGFHIRRSIDPQDMDAWSAFIPNEVDFPRLAPLNGRVLFFKGPSRSWHVRSFKRYHNGKVPVDCKVTSKFHEKSDTAIASDPNRHYSYFLLVFPPGTILDNHCFSGNHWKVKKVKNPMKMEKDDENNPFKKVILGMTIWWRIAVAGGTLIRQAEDADDPKDLYD